MTSSPPRLTSEPSGKPEDEQAQDPRKREEQAKNVCLRLLTVRARTRAELTEQLAKRASFRRTMKRAMDTTMEAGAKGIKIQLAGRLGGSEMARREKSIAGSIPLSTLRAKIDYGFAEAMTAQGHIGVQVWVNQGLYGGADDGADAQEGQAPKKPKRAYKR